MRCWADLSKFEVVWVSGTLCAARHTSLAVRLFAIALVVFVHRQGYRSHSPGLGVVIGGTTRTLTFRLRQVIHPVLRFPGKTIACGVECEKSPVHTKSARNGNMWLVMLQFFFFASDSCGVAKRKYCTVLRKSGPRCTLFPFGEGFAGTQQCGPRRSR